MKILGDRLGLTPLGNPVCGTTSGDYNSGNAKTPLGGDLMHHPRRIASWGIPWERRQTDTLNGITTGGPPQGTRSEGPSQRSLLRNTTSC